MYRIVPISDLQTGARKCVEQIKKTKEPLIITQRGRACAVLVDYDLYEGHKATQEETSYPDWRKRLMRAKKESGKGISFESYLRKRAKGF